MISAKGYPAFYLVRGSNPADLYSWGDQDGDLLFAKDTSVKQWKLRAMAQEAALQEAAKSKLRRLSAHNETFNCTHVEIEHPVPFL